MQFASPPGVILSNIGEQSGGDIFSRLISTNSSTSASTAWLAANLGIFYPVIVEFPFLVRQMAWENGATASGNIDVGIYDENGTRLVSSGTTAQAGVSTIQVVDVTDTWLLPGLYYFGMSASAITVTILATTPGVQSCRVSGIQENTAAFVLPSTVAFTASTRSWVNCIMASSRTVL